MFIANMTKKTNWTDNGPKTEYVFEFEFEGKEEYLTQRDGWRKEYKELSKRIRQHKLWRKPDLLPGDMTSWKNMCTLMTLQEQARMMMQMRMQAKEAAREQMMAERQAA